MANMDDRERASQTSAREELSKQQRNGIISQRESVWKAQTQIALQVCQLNNRRSGI